MKKLIILVSIITACSQPTKHNKRCIVREIKKTKTSTIQEFDPYYTIRTDCGWLATKNKRYKVGDTITIHI